MSEARAKALTDAVVADWSESAVSFQPPAPFEIEVLEQRYGVTLPLAFAAFYRRHNGMLPNVSDDHFIRFWPIGEICPVADQFRMASASLRGFYIFADYSLWAHAYAIRMDARSDEIVAIAGPSHHQSVAPSFIDFLERYVADIDSLL